jgi:outer membrane protein OmpA-like peptidoglycan-associated protein
MKTYKTIVLMLLLLLTAVYAQDKTETTMIGIKAGGTSYLGDIDDQDFSTYGSFYVDQWINDDWALGVVFGLSHLKANQDAIRRFESNNTHVMAMAKWQPFSIGGAETYFTAGLESFSFNPKIDGKEAPNNDAGIYKKTTLAIPFGGGFVYKYDEGLYFDFEVLYHHTFSDYVDDWDAGDNPDRYISATIGLGWPLGGQKDTDGDGIYDKEDKDPLRAEDMDGFEDGDGAPDPDNDGDGVPDVDDKAPMDPEDQDGFEDNDGKPDPDNDGDGILDGKDKAPNDPEDMDGFEDEDGVPDPDNDGDGIADKDDKCPNQPETVNGYDDEDGCPDTKPEIAVAKGAAIVLDGINFASGSSNVTSGSKSTLDKVVNTMRSNPELEIEIRGYTDNTGSLAGNKNLSQKRAESVRQYLIENGIDGTRVKAVGYGPENPIAPNNTREGRAKNRRIEFFRVK